MTRRKSPAQFDREIADVLARPSHAEKIGYRHLRHLQRRWQAQPHRGRSPDHWKGSEVQSLLFARPQWTPSRAKEWAHAHDYRGGKVDVTDSYVRLRQFAPTPGTQKRTITFGDGIKAVIEQVT